MCPADIEEYTEESVAHSQNVQQCVSVLLDKGVPVDCRDAQGRAPLHWAVQLPSECTIMRIKYPQQYGTWSLRNIVYWRSLPCTYTCDMRTW